MKGLQKIRIPWGERSLVVKYSQYNPTVAVARLSSLAAVKPYEEIPGPRSLPIIGTLYKYLPGGSCSMSRVYKTGLSLNKAYGPIVKEEIVPGVVMVRLFNPDDIEAVFRQEGKWPYRIPLTPIKQYRDSRGLAGGLATENGQDWHSNRSLVNKQMMRPAEVSAYLPAQDEVSKDFIKRLILLRDNNNEIPDFLHEMYRWACESIGVVCFDRRVGTLEMKDNEEVLQFISSVNKFFLAMHQSLFSGSLHSKGFNINKAYRDLCSSSDKIWEISMKFIEMAQDSPTNKDSLVQKLLSAPNMKRDEALTMISDLFTGGVDTTAHSLAFNLYQLARNPTKQRKLYEEIMNKVPEGTPLNEKIVNSLSYLRACMKETMRLTPIAVPGTMRILDKDIVLSGYRVPAGVNIHFQNDVISRMPQYFDDPETFIPERWLRDERKEGSCPIHPFASLPFGHGPRMCVGKRFAEQELVTILIKLVRNFDVQYHYEDIGQVLRLVNMPDKPLRFTLLDRKN